MARHKQWEEAEAAVREAVSLAHTMPYPYAEARALERWGLMDLERGEAGQAREHLAEALVIFRQLDARKDIERMEQELVRHHRRRDGRSASGRPGTLPRR